MRAGLGVGLDDVGHPRGQVRQHRQVGPHDLDAHGRLDARREHVDAGADGHRPRVREARHLHDLVHPRHAHAAGQDVTVNKFVGRDRPRIGPHPLGPGGQPRGPAGVEARDGHLAPLSLVALQRQGRLVHAHRGGVGGGLGAADLAHDATDFGEHHEHLLKEFAGLRGRNAGVGRRHIQKIALFKRRHELAAEVRHHAPHPRRLLGEPRRRDERRDEHPDPHERRHGDGHGQHLQAHRQHEERLV